MNMNNTIGRIQKIKLTNFKNVKHGEIEINKNIDEYFKNESDLIGIYGQNGSGKSAVVEAMSFIKEIIQGSSLPKNILEYIYKGKTYTKLELIFSIENSYSKYELYYDIKISKEKEDQVMISEENIHYKRYNKEKNKWEYKKQLIMFDRDEKQTFNPKKVFDLLINSKNKVDAKVAKELSKKQNISYIFSNEMEEIYGASEDFKEFKHLILGLKHFVKYNLFVIKNSTSGIINANIAMPLSFQIKNQESLSGGEFPIFFEPRLLEEKNLKMLKKIIDQLNIVMKEIIPNLYIGIKNYGVELSDSGEERVKVEIVAKREDIIIPIRYESDGIKKIISFLSVLIGMFNNPTICLIVDEFDANIFEYLLGELLKIIESDGKGQFIFTSHNLRPLEKLNKESLRLTTTNPDNRYITFSKIKESNNLRKSYYRMINLGGQDEEIYDETNYYKIAMAFKILGRKANE